MVKRLTVIALVLICMSVVAHGKSKQWRAIHLLDYNTDSQLEALGNNLEALAKQGINVIVLEVDYNFAFKSHPELRRGTNPITHEGARKFAALCRKFGIRLIPEFQSVGHQSWQAETFRCSLSIRSSISRRELFRRTKGFTVGSGTCSIPRSGASSSN